MTSADCETLLEIDKTLFGAADRYDARFMQRILMQDDMDAIVAESAPGEIVAWALVDRARSPVRIRSLSVHALHQRRGYGETLLRHIIAKYGTPIDLLVEQSNIGAVGLYRKMGFLPAGFDPELTTRPRMLLDS